MHFDRANFRKRHSFPVYVKLVARHIEGVPTLSLLLEFGVLRSPCPEVDKGGLEVRKRPSRRISMDVVRPGKLHPTQGIKRLFEQVAIWLW